MTAYTEYDDQRGRLVSAEPDHGSTSGQAAEAHLNEALGELADQVVGTRGMDALLADVAALAKHAIPGVDGAGVRVTEESGESGVPRPDQSATTAGFVAELDAVQHEVLGEGPSLSCVQSRRTLISGWLGSDSRWPRFGRHAERIGVRSGLSVPLLVDEQLIGSINCYAFDRDVFGAHAVALAARFARPAAVSVCNAGLLVRTRDHAANLQEALKRRAIVNQAIGLLRGRAGISADEAFKQLKHISQTENIKLHRVAARVVEDAVRNATPGPGQC